MCTEYILVRFWLKNTRQFESQTNTLGRIIYDTLYMYISFSISNLQNQRSQQTQYENNVKQMQRCKRIIIHVRKHTTIKSELQTEKRRQYHKSELNEYTHTNTKRDTRTGLKHKAMLRAQTQQNGAALALA